MSYKLAAGALLAGLLELSDFLPSLFFLDTCSDKSDDVSIIFRSTAIRLFVASFLFSRSFRIGSSPFPLVS